MESECRKVGSPHQIKSQQTNYLDHFWRKYCIVVSVYCLICPRIQIPWQKWVEGRNIALVLLARKLGLTCVRDMTIQIQFIFSTVWYLVIKVACSSIKTPLPTKPYGTNMAGSRASLPKLPLAHMWMMSWVKRAKDKYSTPGLMYTNKSYSMSGIFLEAYLLFVVFTKHLTAFTTCSSKLCSNANKEVGILSFPFTYSHQPNAQYKW